MCGYISMSRSTEKRKKGTEREREREREREAILAIIFLCKLWALNSVHKQKVINKHVEKCLKTIGKTRIIR